MIYASADVGKEYIPNKLIALSDKIANKMLSYISEHPKETIGLKDMTDQPYTQFRLWHVE